LGWTAGIYVWCVDYLKKNTPKISSFPTPIPLNNITIQGELKQRIDKNFERLEKGRYLPDSLYLVPNPEYHYSEWPGDMPGRLVLSLTLHEQIGGHKAKYLSQILNEYPLNMNEKGYFGKIYGDSLNEQQLASHGWVLRALCENYQYTKSDKVLTMIKTIVNNLVLPTKGYHKIYPIDPTQRVEAGGIAGSHSKTIGKWILSTDIGCDFIFMDGVIHAYEVLKTDDLKSISEEMIARFLEADLVAIKAQTHATLTALRAILRYYSLTQDAKLLNEVEKRFAIYTEQAMTENGENYNWFQRPLWTEPCAIVDSYIVASQLWQFTGNQKYLLEAQHIYYNGISVTQRHNGGFGCNSCTGAHNPFLTIALPEADFCCSMRGAEGFARVTEYAYLTQGSKIFITTLASNTATLNFEGKVLKLRQKSEFPVENKVCFEIAETSIRFIPQFYFLQPDGTENVNVKINGSNFKHTLENGFVVIKQKVKKGDKIEIAFDMNVYSKEPTNSNSIKNYYSFWYGPFMLGLETNKEVFIPRNAIIEKTGNNVFQVKGTDLSLKTLNHNMDSKFSDTKNFKFQVMFTDKK